MKNTIYYGHDLPIMREHIPNESVDLVYLDPPFDSPSDRKIPKLQIRTIEQLLESKEFDFPRGYSLRSGWDRKLSRSTEQGRLEM